MERTPRTHSIRVGFQTYHIPPRMMGGIDRYVEQGIIPGEFLQAIICNDLRESVYKADEENMANLPAYVSYFYTHCPANCWGSRERMLEWHNKGGTMGITMQEAFNPDKGKETGL